MRQPQSTLRTYVPSYPVNWDSGVWQQYLARGNAQVRGGAVSAVFDGVPYIAVQSWNPGSISVSDLDAFLDAFRDRPALILDVRMRIEYTANGQVIEDQGIAPGVAVPVSAGDFQSGRDPVLDYAITRAAHQPTSSERRD